MLYESFNLHTTKLCGPYYVNNYSIETGILTCMTLMKQVIESNKKISESGDKNKLAKKLSRLHIILYETVSDMRKQEKYCLDMRRVAYERSVKLYKLTKQEFYKSYKTYYDEYQKEIQYWSNIWTRLYHLCNFNLSLSIEDILEHLYLDAYSM